MCRGSWLWMGENIQSFCPSKLCAGSKGAGISALSSSLHGVLSSSHNLGCTGALGPSHYSLYFLFVSRLSWSRGRRRMQVCLHGNARAVRGLGFIQVNSLFWLRHSAREWTCKPKYEAWTSVCPRPCSTSCRHCQGWTGLLCQDSASRGPNSPHGTHPIQLSSQSGTSSTCLMGCFYALCRFCLSIILNRLELMMLLFSKVLLIALSISWFIWN